MALDPLNGETPLSSNTYQNVPTRGGSNVAANNWAFQDFVSLFGRNPTASELAILSNPYMTGDPNILNLAGGKANIAQYYQDQLNNPIHQKKANEANAGQYSGSVNDIYQQLLKRGATDAEVKHFGGLLASGEVDPYELQQFIESTKEVQDSRDKEFRSQVGGELTNLDTQAFGRQKEDVISRFASAGRLGSSALDFAITDLMGKVAEKRQGFLANLSANQYQGNKENARADYGNVLAGMNDTTNYERGLNDTYRTRGWNVSDYNQQRDDYMRALEKQNKPGWMDYLNFGLNAARTGVQTYGAGKKSTSGW